MGKDLLKGGPQGISHQSMRVGIKRLVGLSVKRSHSQAVDMAKLCSHDKGAGFIQKTNQNEKNELKKIKGCMQFRKIGMCEVMPDKAMESGLQDMDGEGALKEKYV